DGLDSEPRVAQAFRSRADSQPILTVPLDQIGQINATIGQTAFLPRGAAVGRNGDAEVGVSGDDQSVRAAIVIDPPRLIVRGSRGDDVRRVELKHDVSVAFIDHAFAIVAVSEIGCIEIDTVSIAGLAGTVADAIV